MTPEKLRKVLKAVAAGRKTPEAALRELRSLPFEDIGFARVDHHRELRTGFPEVIFCQGKTAPQVVKIAARMAGAGSTVLCTRASDAQIRALRRRFPKCRVEKAARAVVLGRRPRAGKGRVAVVSAGTSDMPVAEEARVTAELAGAKVVTVYDAGVAGIHRVLADQRELASCDAVVVVAGMEGALASVVGGLVAAPVVACPTSVGYGASFGGVAALLSMLNSCAPGVTVVNIDNGFGAGYAAGMIARTAGAARTGTGKHKESG
ncbi:MAG: nickel pincer cofactor biosynthesis protein LarB [Planctomycetota bacterium]|jgi:NCAIR mutase (PurE)-related protein